MGSSADNMAVDSDLEDMSIQSSPMEMQREERMFFKVQDLWDNFKVCEIFIIGIAEEERTEQKKHLK